MSLSAPLKGSAQQWLSYIESLHPENIEMGLGRLAEVALRLGIMPNHPDRPFVVTVAGTNGKGSCLALLEQTLLCSGLRVGVYSSPHLLCFGERLRIDGVDSQNEHWVPAFIQVEKARGTTQLTFFEFTTLAAFLLLQECDVDVWLLEVGLGGRLDAVNWLDTDLAVVTRIALDHQAWLGNTLQAIAKEKCGIFRKGKPALYGGDVVGEVIGACAQAVGACLIERADYEFGCTESNWYWQGRDAHGRVLSNERMPMPKVSLDIAALCAQALPFLPFTLKSGAFVSALQRCTLPGRFQVLEGDPVFILDVAHNPDAANRLALLLRDYCKDKCVCNIWAVFGVMADKDWVDIVLPLKEMINHWLLMRLPAERAQKLSILENSFKDMGLSVDIVSDDSGTALMRDQVMGKITGTVDCIVVFGSFYTVAPFLASCD